MAFAELALGFGFLISTAWLRGGFDPAATVLNRVLGLLQACFLFGSLFGGVITKGCFPRMTHGWEKEAGMTMAAPPALQDVQRRLRDAQALTMVCPE